MVKKKIKLLAIQMESAIGDIELNIESVKNLLEANLTPHPQTLSYNGLVEGSPDNVTFTPDIVFLPELWTVGWDCPSFPESAETLEESKAIKMLQEIAKKFNVNIIGGSFVRKDGDKLFNTCPVIGRNGELICTYDKNHLFSYLGDTENSYITVGSNPVMVEIEGVKLGLTICYDIRFPEIYRAYRKAGADILVNMAAWPKTRKIHWDTLTTARAVENQSYVVALTQTGLLSDGSENLGHSMIIDYSGNILSEIEEKEGGIFAEIDLDNMYNFRKQCTVLKDIKDSYEVIKK